MSQKLTTVTISKLTNEDLGLALKANYRLLHKSKHCELTSNNFFKKLNWISKIHPNILKVTLSN
jgi:hypothetical protein